MTKVKSKHDIKDRTLCGSSQRVKAVYYCCRKRHLSSGGGSPLAKINVYIKD